MFIYYMAMSLVKLHYSEMIKNNYIHAFLLKILLILNKNVDSDVFFLDPAELQDPGVGKVS